MEKQNLGKKILGISVASTGKCVVGYDDKEIENSADLIDALSNAMYGFLKMYESLPSDSPLRYYDGSNDVENLMKGDQILSSALDLAIVKFNDFDEE